MRPVSQLALSVQLPDDETFSSFISEENIPAIEQLKHFLDAQINKPTQNLDSKPSSFYLFGICGVGKSHLLHASCSYAEQLGLSSLSLSCSELTQLSVEVLEGLEHIDLVCLDDIQLIAADEKWQQAVFDLYNRILEQNRCLIITGDQRAQELVLTLPDLVSRLSWGYTEQIKPLSDDEKLLALQYRAQQRGLMLNDDAGRFLINRLSREMSALIESLDRLDKASIREQRKITIPFIKYILF